MFLGRVTNYTSVANAVIPFATELNTNNKTTNASGSVTLNKPGIYNIDSSLNVSAATGTTVGPVLATIYADGVARATVSGGTPAAVSEPFTLSLTDAIRVIYAAYPNTSTIDVRLDTAGYIVNGTLRIEYLQ